MGAAVHSFHPATVIKARLVHLYWKLAIFSRENVSDRQEIWCTTRGIKGDKQKSQLQWGIEVLRPQHTRDTVLDFIINYYKIVPSVSYEPLASCILWSTYNDAHVVAYEFDDVLKKPRHSCFTIHCTWPEIASHVVGGQEFDLVTRLNQWKRTAIIKNTHLCESEELKFLLVWEKLTHQKSGVYFVTLMKGWIVK